MQPDLYIENSDFNNCLINTLLLHISVVCYTIFHFYVLIETKDNNFINNKVIYNNKPQLTFLIKTKLKMIFNEQILFRVILVEIMSLFLSHELIKPIWSFIFAFYYFKYYKHNVIIRIANFINIFVISYFVLINVPFLVSLFINYYLELIMLTLNIFLYKHFEIKLINTPKKIQLSANVKAVLNKHHEEELASKEEVEALLSSINKDKDNKKMN